MRKLENAMKWEVSILPDAHSDFDIQCGSMQLLADVMARTRVLRWEVTELLLLSKHLLNFRRYFVHLKNLEEVRKVNLVKKDLMRHLRLVSTAKVSRLAPQVIQLEMFGTPI